MRPIWFLLAALWAGSHCSSSSSGGKSPLLLVLSLDGFWYKYRALYKTPHLDRLASEGVQAEYLRNAYVTKTFPNHFTIATGLYEESHGIVANAMFDPVLNETFDESSREPKWWDNGFSLPIWAANQMHGGRSGSMMWPGGDVPIHGVTTHYVQSYDAAINFTTRVDRVISWFLDQREPANCVFFYYEEPDATGHVHGPLSPITGARVEAVDALVGELVAALKRAKLWDRIHLLVVSDHGMAPVTHVSALDEVLPADLYRAYGTSPVFNILPAPGREDEVHKRLSEAASRLHFRVYRSSEIPPEYHYQHNARILPILVEAEPGWDLVRSKQEEQENRTYGNHGYSPSLDWMHPLFVARGPLLRKGLHVGPLASVNLYPLMGQLLGLPSWPSNGSLHTVRHFLQPAPSNLPLLLAAASVFLCTTVGLVALVVCGQPRSNANQEDEEPLLLLSA